MESNVVFEGTPLANYLAESDHELDLPDPNDNSSTRDDEDDNDFDGDHDDELDDTRSAIDDELSVNDLDQADLSGWGIEPSLGNNDNTPRESAASRVFRGIGPLPLTLNASTGKAILRRQRFRRLVTSALQPKLNESENLQFLERFRYVLVSSDLLDARVSVHNLHSSINNNNSSGNMDTTNEEFTHLNENERHRVLFGDDGPWSVLKMHDKYWVGGGGCVVIMVTLLTWHVRNNHAKKSSAASLVIVLCLGLYLFAHSRRRRLRMLRAKAIAYASHFIKNNQQFDNSISKCVGLITEVDLLIQGYRPDLAEQRKIGATGNMDSRMAAKHLRSGLSATLYLAMNSYLDAVSECLQYCSHLDLMRYLDIYDVRVEELGLVREGDRLQGPLIVLPREMYYGADGANASLHKLKQGFAKLHLLRRTLMCCFLSIPSDGECDRHELAAWSCATHHAKSIGELVQQLSRAVVNQHRYSVSTESAPLNPTMDWRGHTRSINDLSSTLQHVEARLQVLGDASCNSILDSPDYNHHYELLGEEIRHMLETWEHGLQDLGAGPAAPTSDSIQSPLSSSTTLLAEDDDWRPFSPRPGDVLASSFPRAAGHRRTDTCSTSSSVTIIQGVSEEDPKRKPSGMTRHERIKLMQQSRDAERDRRAEQTAKTNFVSELDNVLVKRRAAL